MSNIEILHFIWLIIFTIIYELTVFFPCTHAILYAYMAYRMLSSGQTRAFCGSSHHYSSNDFVCNICQYLFDNKSKPVLAQASKYAVGVCVFTQFVYRLRTICCCIFSVAHDKNIKVHCTVHH